MVRPRPTWAAVRPTIWVKNTALPVRKVPSPTAKRIDCEREPAGQRRGRRAGAGTRHSAAGRFGAARRSSRSPSTGHPSTATSAAAAGSPRRPVADSGRRAPGRARAVGRRDLRLHGHAQAGGASRPTRCSPRPPPPRAGWGRAAGGCWRCRRRTSPGCRSWSGRWSPATSRCCSRPLTAGAPTGGSLAGADPAAPAARRAPERRRAAARRTPSCSAAARSTRRCAAAADAGVHVVATYGASRDRRRLRLRRRPARRCRGRGRDGRPDPDRRTHPLRGVRRRPRPATREALVDGWYLTSDAGRLDEDGRLQVLGRLDDVVVSGGVNVPGPAVAARLREHPAVAAAEVLGVRTRSGATGSWPSSGRGTPVAEARATGWARRTRARGHRAGRALDRAPPAAQRQGRPAGLRRAGGGGP